MATITPSRIPIVATLKGYRREYLRPDLVAGIVLATMLIPQGMAYAELTGLPAITGIYTTIAALVGYAIVGPNRQLVLGPDSSLAPVIAAVILPLSLGDAGQAVVLASAMSILAGAVCIAAGWLRLGVITELLSKPVRVGYLNGIAIVVLISQLPKALGFSVEADSTIGTLVETIGVVWDGGVVWQALALSGISVVIIVGLRRITPVIPGVVIATAGSIAVAWVWDLEAAGLSLVGDIPSGLPPFSFPTVGLDVVPTLLGGAILVALVSFADTGALSTATALQSGQRVDPNDEIRALGVANFLSGLFQGFPTSASSSRTAVAMSVGSKTQVTGLIAAIGVIGAMFVIPDAISILPTATLAAIVITASLGLFDWDETVWLAKARTSEFVMLLSAFAGVVVLGVLEGIAVAVLVSLANFVRKALRPHSTELGRIDGVPGYHDLERHPEATTEDGLLILRFDAPLFFANAPTFARRVQELLEDTDRPIRRVLVVANAITDIDTTGAEVLNDLLEDLEARGIDFWFAGLKGVVKDRLVAYSLYQRLGDGAFWPNTISAVEAHRAATRGT